MTPGREERGARWLAAAPVLALLHLALLALIHMRPGRLGPVLWQVGPLALTAAAIVALGFGLVQALGRRLHWTPWRAAAFLLLVVVAYMPLTYRTYPSSRDAQPSAVRFRLPLDGPVTVAWGGATRDVNYHVRGAAERWAYDLLVTERGQSYRTSGLAVSDYYAYGLPVRAPAGGRVIAATDDIPDSRLGARDPGACGTGGGELDPNERLSLSRCIARPQLPLRGGNRRKEESRQHQLVFRKTRGPSILRFFDSHREAESVGTDAA